MMIYNKKVWFSIKKNLKLAKDNDTKMQVSYRKYYGL